MFNNSLSIFILLFHQISLKLLNCLFSCLLKSLDHTLPVFAGFLVRLKISSKDQEVKSCVFILIVVFGVKHAVSIKVAELFVLNYLGLFHYTFIGLGYNSNKEVEKNYKQKELIHEPKEPDKINCYIRTYFVMIFKPFFKLI